MKNIRNILSVLLCICLLSSLTAVFAENADIDAETDKVSLDETVQPHAEEWDALTSEFLDSHGYDSDRITLGYYNLSTGEEHYLNPDMYMAAGSMYKVATSMYYCDKIDSGELEWDSLVVGYKLERAIELMIINSDNNTAQLMWKNVGSWKEYRRQTATYFGVDPDNVDPYYYKDNYLTPRQMITELRQVYDNIDGKYQKIYECMSKAEPYKYFKNHEQKYEMGHKYGWIELEGHLCINDSAIIYAADPIAIVMFTMDVSKPVGALADFCTAACEFCDEMAAGDELEELEKLKEQEELEELERQKALAEQDSERATEIAAPQVSDEPEQTADPTVQLSETEEEIDIMVIIIGAAALIGIIAVIVISVKKKMNAAWGMLAVLLFSLGLLLCCSADKIGLLYCAPSGDPAQTVRTFMDSVISGDYPTAYACVENYSGLGLENTPDSYDGELIYNALRRSYSYSFDGNCETDKLTSRAKVDFTYLDTKAMAAELAAQAEVLLPELLEGRSNDEVYDGSGYLESFTDEVYTKVLETVLPDAEKYYTTKELTFELSYSNGGWYIELDNDIINAISGGTAY